jgi:two-component system, LuxR family, sensor kinase FixL
MPDQSSRPDFATAIADVAPFRRRRREFRDTSAVGDAAALSGAVLHELKQPLTSMLLNAQAAASLIDDGGTTMDVVELRKIIDDIICADRRASVVMARVGSLLRNEPLATERLSASELIDEVLAITHGEIVLHRVAMECHVDAAVPHMSADRVQIQQVLVNLIVNACEAMEVRPATERCLRIRATADSIGYCRLSLSDTGPGIALLPPDSVFEPFVTSKPNGLGLGLAICRKIVAAHGGKIRVQNNDARGATFDIRMPAFAERPAADNASREALHASRHSHMLQKLRAAQAANLRLRDEHCAILSRVQRDQEARAAEQQLRGARPRVHADAYSVPA